MMCVCDFLSPPTKLKTRKLDVGRYSSFFSISSIQSFTRGGAEDTS